jgi:hypothetical protein
MHDEAIFISKVTTMNVQPTRHEAGLQALRLLLLTMFHSGNVLIHLLRMLLHICANAEEKARVVS